MRATDQGKRCRERKDRPEHSFSPKIVSRFIFEIIAGDIPKRSRASARITRARLLECDRMVIVICDRRSPAFALATVEWLAASRTDDWECWFHNCCFLWDALRIRVGFKNYRSGCVSLVPGNRKLATGRVRPIGGPEAPATLSSRSQGGFARAHPFP